jgi:hypothetical protein
MIQGRNGSCLTGESVTEIFVGQFDGNSSAQPRVLGSVDLTHPSYTNQRENFVWSEPSSGS